MTTPAFFAFTFNALLVALSTAASWAFSFYFFLVTGVLLTLTIGLSPVIGILRQSP